MKQYDEPDEKGRMRVTERRGDKTPIAQGRSVFETPEQIEERERKGSKLAMDITPRNLKNLQKRLKDDDFTGGANLDKRIEEQRRIKKMMKNKKGKA